YVDAGQHLNEADLHVAETIRRIFCLKVKPKMLSREERRRCVDMMRNTMLMDVPKIPRFLACSRATVKRDLRAMDSWCPEFIVSPAERRRRILVLRYVGDSITAIAETLCISRATVRRD